MSAFYADTSVLLKQHVDEPGNAWFRQLVVSQDVVIMTTELSLVEVYSAFNRLVREGRLAGNSYEDLTTRLKRLFQSRYALIPTSTNVFKMACELLERHPLRAYDAMHLASAIFANQPFVTTGEPGLTFLSADHRLLAAATGEGFAIFNPAAAT
jgi:predicted nucleic acid-binding protein